MLWPQFDEYIYHKIVMLNGVKGPLSSLIEAVKLVRSMAGYKDD